MDSDAELASYCSSLPSTAAISVDESNVEIESIHLSMFSLVALYKYGHYPWSMCIAVQFGEQNVHQLYRVLLTWCVLAGLTAKVAVYH